MDLKAMIQSCVIRDREFTLRSGRTSNFYFDGRLVTLTPDGSRLVGEAILKVVRELDITAIGGPTTGACPLVSATGVLASLAKVPLKLFYVRAEPKEHGTQKAIEGPSLASGDRVLLVDDVVTSGGSIVRAAKRIEEESGAKVEHTLCLVNREEGGAEALAEAGITLHALFTKTGLS